MPENIILWRHAEANDIFDGDDVVQSDMQRALTEKGHRQATNMAKWLRIYLPKSSLLVSSPALRAYQTADALRYKINIHQALKPSASLSEVLACVTQSNARDSLVVVGHQPWLGQLAAHLLGFSNADLAIKKGAIWWLRLNKTLHKAKALDCQTAQYNIHTVQTPSLL